MNAHTAPLRTGGTLGLQRALPTCFFRKVNGTTGNKGHLLPSRALDALLFPVQNKSPFVKVFADPNRPGFAVDFQLITALTHQMATQIGSVDMKLLERNSLPLQVCTDLLCSPLLLAFSRRTPANPNRRSM